MGSIGSPWLKLGNAGRGSHKGNVRGILFEALLDDEEYKKGYEVRHCKDEDYDAKKTKNNIYIGNYKTAQSLLNYWQEKADAYRIIDKKGRERKLRSDANIGACIIGKVDKDYMLSLSVDQQKELLEDWIFLMSYHLKERGLKDDCAVIHMDEGVPHVHVFFHDEQYQLGRKLNIKFNDMLNSKIPEELRKRGWDIRDMKAWEYTREEYQNLSDEEKQEIILEKKAKKHGLSSAEYKAQQELKKQREELERQKQELIEQKKTIDGQALTIWKQKKELEKQTEELGKQKEALEKETETVDALRATYEKWNNELQNEKAENKELIALGKKFKQQQDLESLTANIKTDQSRRNLDLGMG